MVQTDTVKPETLSLLNKLMSWSLLEPYYLVGGTALALQLGHRVSVDLDFHGKVRLDKDELKLGLEAFGKVELIREFDKVYQFEVNKVYVDIVSRNYTLIKPIVRMDGLRLASIEDIAAMKIFAIESRGKKRDFFDLYCLLDKFSLDEIIDFTSQKYSHTNKLHVIRSLLDFEDAEEDEDPVMLIPVSWDQVKEKIKTEVKDLALEFKH